METIMRTIIFALCALGLVCALGISDARAADVCEVQEALQQRGYYYGPIDCDEGPMTYRAIRHFQLDNDLDTDGIVGEATAARLFGYRRYYDND
jgi:peptidoglycan hydrolase-like protein with peptidoglycan-binding domain